MTGSWLRRAWPLVRAHRIGMGIALGASFASLVLQVQIPAVLNTAVTRSLQQHKAALSSYVIQVVLYAVAAGVTGYVSRLLLMRTAYAIEYDLRTQLYEHLSTLSFAFYDRVQTGQLISRANSDIRSVQMYLTFAPAIVVQCLIGLVAFAYMLALSVPLAFVAMLTLPLVFVLSARMRNAMFPVSWLIQARLAEVATVVDENVNGVRVVRSFAAEPGQVRALARAAERLQWAYVKDADLRARFTPAVQNLPQIGLALILGVGGFLVDSGRLSVGAILAFSAYVVMLQAPFQMLGMLVMLGQRAAASAARIFEVLDERPDIVGGTHHLGPAADQTASPHPDRGDLVVDAVDFGYPGQQSLVLRGLSLQVPAGSTVAVVGRTGSGKTTLARLLARFYDPTSGAIRLDGEDLRELSLPALRSAVGVVLDEAFLFSVSVADNIAYGRPDADRAMVHAAAAAAGAADFIEDLPAGYDTVVGERGYTLSGGQRQRIALARALLVNPPVLVLDDATSAVDVTVEHEIFAQLRRLMTGRTTVIIAHRLSTISLADRVLLLEDGRIIADGTHAELLATVPTYAEVLDIGSLDDDAPPGAVAASTAASPPAARVGR